MLQRDYPDQVCSIARSLEVIGERWTMLIVRDAVIDGVTRFEDFQESLAISTNVLANRLKLLCEEEVLERVPDPDRPGRPMYLPTQKGQELAPILFQLLKWGDRHYPTLKGPPRLTLHVGCGGNVGANRHCDLCGKPVAPGEMELKLGPGAPRPKRAAR